MKIVDLEAYLCHYPLPAPFFPTWIPGYPQTRNSCIIIRLITDQGLDGVTAGVAFLDEAKGLLSLLRPFILNRDPFLVEDFMKMLRSALYLGYKAFAVECAFWDIIGKAAGLPLYKLWGGGPDRIKAYCSTGEMRDPVRRIEGIKALKEMGFKAVKLRIKGMTIQEDVENVAAVVDAVGDDMEIMVDANQGWPIHGFGQYPTWTLKRAMETAAIFEELGIRWLEEPLHKNDYEGYSRLRDQTIIDIATGEQNVDLHEFRELISRGCADVIQPDVTLATGLLGGKKVAGMAEAFNLQFSPHTWTHGLGFAANLQLMASVPNNPYCEFPYEPPGWVPEARDFMLTEPIMIDKEGFVHVPQKPGLGVEIDWARVKSCGEKL